MAKSIWTNISLLYMLRLPFFPCFINAIDPMFFLIHIWVSQVQISKLQPMGHTWRATCFVFTDPKLRMVFTFFNDGYISTCIIALIVSLGPQSLKCFLSCPLRKTLPTPYLARCDNWLKILYIYFPWVPHYLFGCCWSPSLCGFK